MLRLRSKMMLGQPVNQEFESLWGHKFMDITPIKTEKITPGALLHSILDHYLPPLQEKDIVVVTSKIVSICQGRVIKNDGKVDKYDLIRREAQYYLEEGSFAKYGIILTVKDQTLIASSGIDESNGDGYFVLWPKEPHQVAANIWQYLRKKFNLKSLGVLITDSHTTPLRWGTTGIGLAWCGFQALKDYIGTPDIFGRKLQVTKASILDGLAAAAVVTMGEGNEQTPLALIRRARFVNFMNRPPTAREVKSLQISLKQDIYAPLIDSPKWRRGGARSQV